MVYEIAVCIGCRREDACRIFQAFGETVAMCELCIDAQARIKEGFDPPPGTHVHHCGTVTLAELDRLFEEE